MLSRRTVVGGALGATFLLVAASGAWLFVRANEARAVVAQMQADAHLFQQQLHAYDLAAAGPTLGRLRTQSTRARDLTGDPVWWVAAHVPVAGQDIRAARDISAALADITTATRPLETAFPLLDEDSPTRRGGRIDVDALSTVAETLPAVSDAVTRADGSVHALDADALSPGVAGGVRTLQKNLRALRDPISGLAPSLRIVPDMLGVDGPRTWMVLLQQGAEARGTGGLVGAFAVVRADDGRMDLVGAAQRSVLERRGDVPSKVVPPEIRDLWGKDLTEWAGLNLSPHFPWTGELVSAGWTQGRNGRPLDYVTGIDQGSVSALLAGTGPVTVRGITVTPENASQFLSRDIYSHFPDPHDVDAVTAELVQQVFQRLAAGRLNLAALVSSMAEPVRERRLLVWSSDPEEQARIEKLTIGGAIPDKPGPFAMAVVNNGGGNKLDAYLKVRTRYTPGSCAQGVRTGHIVVTLDSEVPNTPLPEYVTPREDLTDRGLTNRVIGSNRVLLDVYGPVGAQSPLTTLDGAPVPVTVGVDRNHTVWRAAVPINPGQQRVVDVVVNEPQTLAVPQSSATLLTQPMPIPAMISAAPVSPCGR